VPVAGALAAQGLVDTALVELEGNIQQPGLPAVVGGTPDAAAVQLLGAWGLAQCCCPVNVWQVVPSQRSHWIA